MMPVAGVRASISEEIERVEPGASAEGWICLDDLNRFRTLHIERLLATEKGELTSLDEEVVASIRNFETVAADTAREFEQHLTLGEWISDVMADFGGSWKFLGLFAVVMVAWIVVNSWQLLGHPYDPYPYILLNLVLSCLAALQAPVIMMSQNRQDARDRLRSEHDYRVNLKAEIEIRALHDKLDHLLANQWARLVEIQQIQIDVLNELEGMRRARAVSAGAPTTK